MRRSARGRSARPCESSPKSSNTGGPYQGSFRFVYWRPISVACWLAGPIMTPSLIMSMTFEGFIEFKKKILLALHAADMAGEVTLG